MDGEGEVEGLIELCSVAASELFLCFLDKNLVPLENDMAWSDVLAPWLLK